MTKTEIINDLTSARGECSPEIAEAIVEIAQRNVGPEGDLEAEAWRIWDDPSPAEDEFVVQRAWELADETEETLNWGVSEVERPRD